MFGRGIKNSWLAQQLCFTLHYTFYIPRTSHRLSSCYCTLPTLSRSLIVYNHSRHVALL